MSVVVTSRVGRGRAGGLADYLEHAEKGSGLARVEACISDLGDTPDEYAAQLESLLAPTSRRNDGQSLVISFSESEFPSAGDHGEDVAAVGYELARRGAPGAPLLVVSQRDGAGGRWHAHVIVGNHDVRTGTANRGNWYHEHWRRTNDELMQELGLEVCGRTAELSRAQRVAQARGVGLQSDAELVAMSPAEVPRDRVESFIGAHVAAAVMDGRIASLPEPGEEQRAPLGDGVHELSIRAKGTGLSYAVVDAGTGEPATSAAGGRGGKPRKLATTGTKLDRELGKGADDVMFTRPAMTETIAALSDDRDQEQEMEDDRRDTPRRATAEEVGARGPAQRDVPERSVGAEDGADQSRRPRSAGGGGGRAEEPAPEPDRASDPGEDEGGDRGEGHRGREDRAQSILASLAARLGVVSTVPATAAGALVASSTATERLAGAVPEPPSPDADEDEKERG